MKKILFVLTVAICSICMVGCQYTEDEFPKITESELQKCLMDKDEAVIFCTQDLCSGCEPVQKSLVKISRDCNIHIQAFDVDTDSAKKLLGQYGLDQVPAIIKISKESIELYKGNLTEENIKRLLLTESVIYDRISNVTAISYSEFLRKANLNEDFFVYFSQDSCLDCINFSEILEEYIQQNLIEGMYVVDISDVKNSLSEEEYKKLLDDYLIHWVPHVMHMKNGISLSFHEYPSLEYRNDGNGDDPKSDAAVAFYDWMNRESAFSKEIS